MSFSVQPANEFSRTILLTGATGVLGARLLLEILRSTRSKVYCLVRARDRAHAASRVGAMMSVYDDSESMRQALRERVEAVPGDVTDPRLGISGDVFQDLSQEAGLVIHAAASVNLIAEFEELQRVNVEGTRNVIRLCQGIGARLVHVSSYSVLGDKLYEREFVFKETDFDIQQNFYEGMSYEQSKFEAERVVRDASDLELDWSIVRPGNIFGDSETGRYPLAGATETGIYYDILRTVVETGYCFDYPQSFDITPVDYVAKGILQVAMSNTSNGRTYHLTNPQPPSFNQISDSLRACGYTLRVVGLDEYMWALTESRMMRAGKPYVSNFTRLLAFTADEDDLVECASYDTAQATALLRRAGIECAQADNTLIKRYVDFCLAHDYLPSPARQERELAEILYTA